ncbi:TPA: hypothetical protein I7747_22885 [Vibrio vulnificus]|uniref:hypothetical protein n=1 Tax=Vibrio vulnificus TaxID=672 RepID=UPI001302C2AA|nr:hypothetical protein [Vibrio vulnificus]MCU8207572.1 hypothetical protein [Vibrio vulnificus]HAS8425415.1 hypothetical protein [Vibrio vulnificus]
MNVFKIIITSIAFPFLYARETLNAVTIPLLIFSLNWAVGLSISKQVVEVGFLSYVIQFFAYSMLLTNCIYVVLGRKVPNFGHQSLLYLKVLVLLVICAIASFVVQFVLLAVLVNVIGVSNEADLGGLQLVCEILAQAVVFWAVLIVPHFIKTETSSFKQLFKKCKPHVLSLLFISIGFQLVVYMFKAPFSALESSVFLVIGSLVTLLAHTMGCFVVAFSYLDVESNARSRLG